MNMENTDRELRFYELFEQLVSYMTDFDHMDHSKIRVKISELCSLLRIAKAVTRLYRNEREEQRGGGETQATFLSNEPCSEVMSKRIVTSVMSICTLTIYKADSEPDLDDFEKSCCDLVMRTVMSYVSRNRLRDIVKELAYFDDNGYKNLRALRHFVMHCNKAGTLGGRAAINYNLRHFALVNQQIGREAGDIVMRTHYETLEGMIGSRGIAVRLGGDNFVCICGREQLPDIIKYLTEAAVVYDKTDYSSVTVTTSAGVFPFPNEYTISSSNDIMGKIVNAFRAAQSGGKEHIVFFDEKLVKGREKSMRVQQLFPEALRNDDFKVFYQPKVDVMTGELRGAEALCRWFHNGEIVSPIDFIPYLEQTNDICKLDMYMLRHVCADIKRWLEEGRQVVKVSVNLSRKNMINPNLLETIMGIINESGIPHKYIEIELTETTTDVEFTDLRRVVSGLQQQGISTSVDDFGIGYSSLNLIRVIPWNVLKVDKSFLPGEGDGEQSKSGLMFRHVIAMAKALGLECIAEGVETYEQLTVLRDSGCDTAQGFFFDKPLPRDEFEKRLEQRIYKIG